MINKTTTTTTATTKQQLGSEKLIPENIAG